MRRWQTRLNTLERYAGRVSRLRPAALLVGADWRHLPLDTSVLVLGGTSEQYTHCLCIMAGLEEPGDATLSVPLRDCLKG
jgi:hypothetical protein